MIEFNIYDEKYKNINDFENNFFFLSNHICHFNRIESLSCDTFSYH